MFSKNLGNPNYKKEASRNAWDERLETQRD
jgi:hypothetical protein